MEIKFTNIFISQDLSMHQPVPANKHIPKWYQTTEPYVNNNEEYLTIKRCVPVLDVISSGYLLLLPCDILVERIGSVPKLTVFGDSDPRFMPLSHSLDQAKEYPQAKKYPFLKWMNPWGIKTSDGYSCLFINPVHRDLPFKILEAIVDTDKFTEPVNFPFILDDKFEGIISAGTPIAQVIPIKRESFSMSIGGIEEYNLAKKQNEELFKYKNSGYKKLFWNKKNYR
jgi:hypothetical protein